MENFNNQDVAQKIMEAIQNTRKNMVNLNVMVLGKTGSGKSTLINNVFNERLAETGTGKPVTSAIREYTKPDFPLTIYDTPGLELGGENAIDNLLKEVNDVIDAGIKTGDINKAIHCIWYCVSTPSHRFEEAEKGFIERFLCESNGKLNVPVILVLTQSYSRKDTQALRDEIAKENMKIAQIVPVLSSDFEVGEFVVRSYGLDRLIEVTNNVIPEAVRDTLVAVQKANIKLKTQKAQVIVATAATTAAGTGFAPIPFADSTLLVPEEIAMLAAITNVYGLSIQKATLTTIISATIGTAGATVLGKTVVSNILKCIPGVGSVVGGAVSGAVAAAITAALGEAYIGIMTLIASGEMKTADLETDVGKAKVSSMFKQRLSLKRDKRGNVETDAVVLSNVTPEVC